MSILVEVDTILGLCYSSAWLAGAAYLLHFTCRFVRNCTYVTVNCWFCNVNSKVLYANKKEWYCPHCQQFNGFQKDGDYSRIIPEQYNESLNTQFVNKPLNKITSKSNGLCRTCNANQELKIKQLALYEPFKEEDYDREIEIFRQRLEKSYKLCSICERTVESTLHLKSTFSSGASYKSYKQIKVKKLEQAMNTGRWKYFILIATAVIALIFIWRTDLQSIHIFGREPTEFFVNLVNKLKRIDSLFSDQRIFNALLLVTAAFFAKSWVQEGRIFGPFLFGVIAAVLTCSFESAVKIALIVLFVSVGSFKYWQNGRKNLTKYREMNELARLIADDSQETDSKKNLFALSSMNNPLCGKFSDLSIGDSNKSASNSKNVSYLFKPTKPLIQPSRLKIDDSDTSETARTSPTVSSGYDSITSYFKRSPDSVSEFDSISQVGRNYDLPELKWRGIRKNNDFMSNYSRWPDFNQSNAITPYFSKRKYSPEPYYEVSPNSYHSSTSHISQLQTNSCFSTIQIVLCSFAFFVLGFSLQLLIKKFVF